MSETSHTPGPWEYIPGYEVFNVRAKVNAPDGTNLAVPQHDCMEQCEADARLIAAAPELLAAIHAIAAETTGFDTEDMIANIQGVCRAAIAKATGGQP